MGLFDRLKARAVASRQRIVLAEGYEPRTLTAADRIIADLNEYPVVEKEKL